MGWSEALSAALREEEKRLATAKAQMQVAVAKAPGKVLPHPKAVEMYLCRLLDLLDRDPVKGREALARHLTPLLVTPVGEGASRGFRITGAFNLSPALNDATPVPFETGVASENRSSGGRI